MLFQRRDLVSSAVAEQRSLEEETRHKRMEKAWARYCGDYPDSLLKTKLDPNAKDNVKLNLAKFAVNTSAFFLFGKGLTFQVDGKPKSDANTYLEEVWESNNKAETLSDMAINGGVFGDVFVRLKLPDKAQGEDYPQILVLDPLNVEVEWEPTNHKRVVRVVNQWNAVEGGKATAYRQTFARLGRGWEIVEEESRGDVRGWTETDRIPWNYPFCPVFHAKNLPHPNCFYGAPDLEDDLLENILDINFLLSTAKRIVRAHGHPKTWGRGFNGKEVDLSVDSLTIINSENGMLQNLEGVGDLNAIVELLKQIKAAFHEMASVPEIAAGKVEDVGQLSGLALKILYGPLLRLTETKRPLYGEMLQQLGAAILEVSGKGKHKVTCEWKDPLPQDDKAVAEAGVAKKEAGVSQDTILTEMGYDPEAEAKKRAKEAQRAQEFGSQLLAQFEQNGLTGNSNPPVNGNDDDTNGQRQ